MKALELADMIERYNAGVMSQAICEDYLKASAELRRLAAVESDCAQYLKEGETPAERIKRELGDADSLMSLYRDVVAERDALKAENERLTNCLKKANDQAEDFERRWYLADMELERIKALPPVGFVQHLNELNDEWLSRLPIGTALYALGSKA